MIKAVGTFVVTTPGSLQRLSAGETNPATWRSCHGVLVQALPSNAGLVYVGDATLNRAAKSGLYAVLGIPTANYIPSFSVALTLAPNGLDLSKFYVDADTATDGVIVTMLEA